MTNKSKKKIQGKKLSPSQLEYEILKLFRKNPKKRLNPRQIAKKLHIDNTKNSVIDALNKLKDQGKLVELEDFKFKIKKDHSSPRSAKGRKNELLQGYVDMTRHGDAYIICDEREDDVHVSAGNLNTALHGDLVKITAWKGRGRRRAEGEVVEVLKRSTEYFLGTFRITRDWGIVIPDKSNMSLNIFIRKADFNGAEEDDKVVVKIIEWHGEKHRLPTGVVTSVLGDVSTSDLEMKAILVNNGFPLEFPEACLEEAKDIPEKIPAGEINRRRDFREITTFTIDPEDAKDFDDALSLHYLENGEYEIGVHIADVTHYIQHGSELDKEAYRRSTSVYLVDRVLPMLPEKLSNNVCSLRPEEERLTFSAVFTFDKNDKIKSKWFGKTIIYSDKRFSYEEAQEVIEKEEGEFSPEIKKLNDLAKKLRSERFKKGSIDFEAEEVRFRLDEDGTPIEVFVKERKEAHMLIEEFMLLANREVATFIHEKGKGKEIPFVYRTHDLPDPDKVVELAGFAREMGVEMNVSTPTEIARSYNRLASMTKENEALKILEPIAIRTMAKAEYSVENIGHYGLGFDYYTHFTSPIRRYSDVLSHRILEGNLDGKTLRVEEGTLDARCKHVSMQERKAMDAERESVKYKQAEFLKKHVGEVFEGYVSGIIDKGIFVTLKNSKCEGLVGFEGLPESFELNAGRLKAVGRRTGRVIKMGDSIHVKIADVDMTNRQIDMELVNTE